MSYIHDEKQKQTFENQLFMLAGKNRFVTKDIVKKFLIQNKRVAEQNQIVDINDKYTFLHTFLSFKI